MTRLPDYVTQFDSGSLPLEALAAHLRGEPYDWFAESRLQRRATRLAGRVPGGLREELYRLAGGLDAIPARRIGDVDAEAISAWATSSYPARRYPAAMIGSSTGAAIHLCAALGIPWLPQTVLVPVRRTLDPDRPRDDLEWGRAPAARLAERNPDLRVHQMHDPNQDRLMLTHMAYFRVKRRRLGPVYEAFLRRSLPRGGTIYLLECGFRWPQVRVSDTHFFQTGGYGGLSPEEYLHGSDRVRAHLERLGAGVRAWDAPPPDGDFPEAEWGFDADLRADAERFAETNGYRLCRIVYDDPVDLSPFVADLHRRWYERLGRPADRLLVESFIMLQPQLALRAGAVPYWMTFNSVRSADDLRAYVEARRDFDEIYLMPFSNSIEAAGLAPRRTWERILSMARTRGAFIGIDPEEYPKDLASFVTHAEDLERLSRQSPPEPLTLDDLADFFARDGEGRVRFDIRCEAPA